MTVIMRIRHGVSGDRDATPAVAAPRVIRDGVDDLWNPVDGSRITSKRAYAKQLAKQGLAIDERPVMRDKNQPGYDDAGLRHDIRSAMHASAFFGDPPAPIPELDDG